MRAIITTPAKAAAICANVSRVLGYPKPGIDAATGAVRTDGVGITTNWTIGFAHPTDATQWAVPVDDVVSALAANPVLLAKMSPAQATALQAAVAAAADLTADWFPTVGP